MAESKTPETTSVTAHEPSVTKPGLASDAARVPNLPSGLYEPITFGFNASTWHFLFKPIFSLTYSTGYVDLPHGMFDVRYDVPDGIGVHPRPMWHGSEISMLRSKRTADQKKFSLAVSATLGAAGVSAATAYSIETSSKVSESDDISTTLVSWYKLIYEFDRTKVGALVSEFTDALADLPATFDPSNKANTDAFFTFFGDWGTHYLKHGFFGGNYIMNTQVNKSVFDTHDASLVQSSIKAKFDDGIVQGSAGVDITASVQKALRLETSQLNAEYYGTGGDGGTNVNIWSPTVSRTPTLLLDAVSLGTPAIRPTFAPIYTLVADAARQEILRKALEAYLPSARTGQGSIFAPPSPVSGNSSVVLAKTDGFAVVCSTQESNAWSLTTIVGKSSQQANAQTLGTVATITCTDPRLPMIDHWLQRGSAILPVRQGTYYNKTTYFGPQPAGAFIAANLQFGDYQELKDLPRAMPTDGFLIVGWAPPYPGPVVGTNEFTLGATTVGLSISGGFSTSPTAYADAGTSSLCVPVPKGTTIARTASMHWGTDVSGLTLGWLPVTDPDWTFGPIQRMSPGTDYTAQTNGFVFATLKIDGDGPRGYLEINTFDTQGKSEQIYAACAAHYFKGTNKYINRSTAMLPIGMDKKWKVSLTETLAPVRADVFWVPILAAP